MCIRDRGGELLKVMVLILNKEANLTETEADNSLAQAVACEFSDKIPLFSFMESYLL